MFSHRSYFCFNDTATTVIYTLSLHDALPISCRLPARLDVSPRFHRGSDRRCGSPAGAASGYFRGGAHRKYPEDRKSTRLNSSHANISYAVFCLKKKKKHTKSSHSSTNHTYAQ